MSQPRVRHDPYGLPLQPVTDARYEPRTTHGSNAPIRRLVLQLLDEQLGLLLQRGVYAHVQVTCHIQNGLLQGEISLGVERQYRYDKDEE